MYAFRTITQTEGQEVLKDVFFEKEYSVVFEIEQKGEVENTSNLFSKLFNDYFTDILPIQKVVAFAIIEEVVYPLYYDSVYYIVNSEGKTFNRIYGKYEKY